MAYVCTVVFDTDVEHLERVEQERPEIMSAILKAAAGRMTDHQRLVRPGQTLDIDEYASEESYREFMAEAGEHIRRYGELLGAPGVDTLWRRVA